MDTYRGYTVLNDDNGAYYWIDDSGVRRGPFNSDEAAFDDIDAYRKNLRATRTFT